MFLFVNESVFCYVIIEAFALSIHAYRFHAFAVCEGCVDRWIDGWMDGRMDERKEGGRE